MFFQIITLTLPLLIPGLVLIFIIKQKWLRFLEVPLDFGLRINGSRLFGDNKTFKGLIVFFVIATIVAWFLKTFYMENFVHSIFKMSPILIGTFYAFTYTIGELLNSAVKRRLSIAPGTLTQSQYKNIQNLIDISDGIVVTALMLVVFNLANLIQAFSAAALGIGLHYFTDVLMRKMSLK